MDIEYKKATCELCDDTGLVEIMHYHRDPETGYEEVDCTGKFYTCTCQGDLEEDNHEQHDE